MVRRMGRLLAIALLVAAAGVAVVVVNGEGENKPKEEIEATTPPGESPKVRESEPEEQVTPARAGGPRAGATVTMKNLRFRPDAVSVNVGEAVRFVNEDDVAHTVFEDVGARSGIAPLVDSRRIRPGEQFTFVARTRGLVAYVCTLHPSVMKGQALVEPPAL
jgi:plastocyanin